MSEYIRRGDICIFPGGKCVVYKVVGTEAIMFVIGGKSIPSNVRVTIKNDERKICVDALHTQKAPINSLKKTDMFLRNWEMKYLLSRRSAILNKRDKERLKNRYDPRGNQLAIGIRSVVSGGRVSPK